MKVFIAHLNYQARPTNFFENTEKADYITYGAKTYNIAGIAKAINTAIREFMIWNADALQILANDIEEQEGWLRKRVEFLEQYPSVGICSAGVNHTPIERNNEDIIGNYLIRREVIEKVGLFNEAFDPYGPIDLDYCHRVRAAGFITTYVPGITCSGVHCSDQTDDIYGYSKQQLVNHHWGQMLQDMDDIQAGRKHYNIPIIEMQQYYGEKGTS